jgi:subtilisin family serine protease
MQANLRIVAPKAFPMKAAITALALFTVPISLHAADVLSAAVNDLYIVQLQDPALAHYSGQLSRFATPARLANGRMDVQSTAAKNYVIFLQAEQSALVQRLEARFKRTIATPFRYQHALNAVAMTLSPAQAALVAKLPEVQSVQANTLEQLDTDAGPYWVQAPQLWFGVNSFAPDSIFASGIETGGGYGEGVVIGMIDSGINQGSPAFAARAPLDGYTHINPLGAGVYKGWCNPGFAAQDRCNAKLIGTWDFVDTQAPPEDDETPGADDENGHGSHTAGIVVGNGRININASNGVETRLRGVAPRANVIAYDACYTRASSPVGLCPTVSTVAAINQAIADGVVDVINYSISGSANPWTDANEQAFLAATAAGIFVAVSGGNSGSTPGIVAHRSPWVTSVAASTAPKLEAGDLLTILQPAGGLSPIGMARALGSTPGLPGFFGMPITGLVSYLPNALGCNSSGGYPSGSFTGRIALLDLALTSQCDFEEQSVNAAAAGAVAAILLDNVRYPSTAIAADVPTQIPVTLLNVGDSARLRALVQANPNMVRISMGSVAPFNYFQNSFADVIAKFSSRGPSPFNDLKPDVTAPGVAIFSADRNSGSGVNDNHVLSGTSMSAPHVAGVAALLLQRQPDWSPMQIKSAILSSAQTVGIVNYDDAPRRQFPASQIDFGAGSVRGAHAAQSVLTVAATAAEFTAANPATGGLVENLNLPNLTQRNCTPQCSFSRVVKNVSGAVQAFSAGISGSPNSAGAAFTGTVSPASFTLASGASQTLQFQINTAPIATGSGAFGSALLSNAQGLVTRFPISVSVPEPTVVTEPTALQATLIQGASVDLNLRVRNLGGPSLSAARIVGPQLGPYLSQLPRLASGQFIASSVFQSINQGVYVADDFPVRAAGQLRRITVPTFSSGNLNSTLSALRLRIYADSSGLPTSNPESAPEQSLWACEIAVGAAGLSISNDALSSNTVRVDIAQLSASSTCPTPPTLSVGSYWFSLYGVFASGNGSNSGTRLNWYSGPSTADSGAGAQVISASGFASGLANWTALSSLGPNISPAMAMELVGSVDCNSSFIASVSPASSTVGAASAQDVTVRVSLPPGTPVGVSNTLLCLQTNDPQRPIVLVPMVVQSVAQ